MNSPVIGHNSQGAPFLVEDEGLDHGWGRAPPKLVLHRAGGGVEHAYQGATVRCCCKALTFNIEAHLRDPTGMGSDEMSLVEVRSRRGPEQARTDLRR